MAYQITVQPSGRQYQAEADESLLDAALRQGLHMPHGCRDGACGACKGKVLEGLVEHGKAQRSAADEAAGLTLFCCAQARSAVTLECAQLRSSDALPVKTLPARIEKLEKSAPDVLILQLRLPANETLAFHAGQYIDILLKDGRKRSFSLANAPGAAELLELHIRHVPGGFFTEALFANAKVRDILRFSGPHGGFYVQNPERKPLILLAGGTGFAPIKAIVEHSLRTQESTPLYIYWGARRPIDLYQHALASQWAAEHAHIRYIPVLSDALPEDAWNGRSGFVHHAVLNDFPDLSGHQVYACGAPAMIDAARRDCINQCALPENQFFADAFTFAAA
ncbi:CDP-6-deoxy-delta-3,4-glucoseen reductase [Azonexus sp.]|uniref:CDP-6-deoxy-delta-3,4-glucoseen reductase n=1 Tax=Azonexus sp. TaxID=1872668 RepID=UPI0039E563EF